MLCRTCSPSFAALPLASAVNVDLGPPLSHLQNFTVSKDAETKFTLLAKTNKLVSSNKDKALPWYLVFGINKQEEIVITNEYPADSSQKLDVDHKSWEQQVSGVVE